MPQFLAHEALTVGDPNFITAVENPIGTIMQSMLTQAQIDVVDPGKWQLCNGSTILVGSTLAGIDPLGTGNVPDTRGRYLSMAGGSTIDSVYTDKVLNESLLDNFQSHRQTLNLQGRQRDEDTSTAAWQYEPFTGQGESVTQATHDDDGYGSGAVVDNPAVGTTGNPGNGSGGSTLGGDARFGAETRPLTYVVSMFIKVN